MRRHGDRAGVERSIAAGGRHGVAGGRQDGALPRARAADVARASITAPILTRGADGRSAIEVMAARAFADAADITALDAVAAALRQGAAQKEGLRRSLSALRAVATRRRTRGGEPERQLVAATVAGDAAKVRMPQAAGADPNKMAPHEGQ